MNSPKIIDILITGGWVLPLDEKNEVIYPGSVAINKGKIMAMGPTDSLDPFYCPHKIIVAKDHVIMPGLINAHGHASNSLVRGLGDSLELQKWISNLVWPIMSCANEDEIFLGVQLSALEMLNNGITTFADMWHGVDAVAEATISTGLRAALAYNIKDFGDHNRGDKELARALDATSKWDGAADGLLTIGLGPHSVYYCRPRLLKACADEARDRKLLIQLHVSENQNEVLDCMNENHGSSPVELLNDIGLLNENVLAAHLVCVDQEDISILRKTNTAVAHNIHSNLRLGSGIAPLTDFLEAKLRVGIGTDGPGSNDSLDLLRDLKTAALVQRGIHRNPSVITANQALRMATIDGAKAIGLSNDIGSLEIGKKADIILIDMDKPHLTPRHYDDRDSIMSLILLSATGADVDYVIVNGRIILDNRVPQTINSSDVISKVQLISRKLMENTKEF